MDKSFTEAANVRDSWKDNIIHCSLKVDFYRLDYQEVSSTLLMWALSKFIAFPFHVLHGAWSKTEQ